MQTPKNIVFLTWKDLRHPHAWGAEKVIFEHARALVRSGHRVVWFASGFRGALPEETIEWIQIIRRYSNHTIWMFAWLWFREYRKNNECDCIVDEAGGWPLLSPLFVKNIPIFFFAHHVGDKEFDGSIFPIGWLAKKVYRWMFRRYRDIPTIAVSESTKQELLREFGFRSHISVVENTTEVACIKEIDFSKKTNDIIFLGRLTAMKRPDHAIQAFSSILEMLPKDSQLHIIGNAQDEQYVRNLRAIVDKLDRGNRVIFHGFLDESTREDMLTRAKCLLVPSEKEGFGLVVAEANARWTIAIGYDVAGLRDSIQDGVNGRLVPDGNWEEMGQMIRALFEDEFLYRTLSLSSLEHARQLPTWQEQTKRFEAILLGDSLSC